jgi:hypothetical protein
VANIIKNFVLNSIPNFHHYNSTMIEHAHGYHHQLFLSLTSISHIFCKYITFMGSFVLISAVLISAFNINLVVLNNVLSTKYPMVLGITYSRSENQEPASFARVRHQLGS